MSLVEIKSLIFVYVRFENQNFRILQEKQQHEQSQTTKRKHI